MCAAVRRDLPRADARAGPARRLCAADARAPDYPWAPTGEQTARRSSRSCTSDWGGPRRSTERGAEPRRRRARSALVGELSAPGASPGAAVALMRMNTRDRRARRAAGRSACRRWSCTAPTTGRSASTERRYMAEHIPGARYVELPGADHLPCVGDSDPILDEIEEFLTGARRRRARPGAGDRPVHRHRRLDRARRGARRPALARAARAPRRGCAPASSSASAAARSTDAGRRLPRHLRRAGARHPVRSGRQRRRRGARHRDPRRPAHRRVRADRRRRRRHRRPHRRARRGARRARARCSSRAPSTTWSPARVSSSRTAACMRSRASRTSGASTRCSRYQDADNESSQSCGRSQGRTPCMNT